MLPENRHWPRNKKNNIYFRKIFNRSWFKNYNKARILEECLNEFTNSSKNIIFFNFQTEDEFLVLACDGIYDVLENWELTQLVRSRLTITDDLKVQIFIIKI